MRNSGSAKAIWLVMMSTAAVGLLILWKFLHNAEKQGQPGGLGPGGKSGPLKVAAVVLTPADLPLDNAFGGNLLASEEVQLTPEISGRITQILFREGQVVKKGQVLLRLFDEDLKAQEEKLMLQETIASRFWERAKSLLASGSGTQQDADNAENQVNNIRADLKILRANLRKTSILAPFSGQIGFCNVSEGAWVTPGNPIVWLRDVKRLKLEFSVPEKYALLFPPGEPVFFRGGPNNDSLTAKIYAIDPGMDEGTRTLKIRGEFLNANDKFRPGSFVQVLPKNKAIQQALMLPSQSLIPDNKGKKVVLYRNGKALFSEVETGIRKNKLVQVIRGVQSGDTVLTNGLMFVKPGADLILTRIEPIK
jgi:membrane fusion protein (multidrug efflux system)